MSVDLRLRHDRLLREQAVEMFERGFGYGLTARRLGVSAETVREWQKMYRTIGRGTQPPENTTNTSHNELLHQDPLQPPLEPRVASLRRRWRT